MQAALPEEVGVGSLWVLMTLQELQHVSVASQLKRQQHLQGHDQLPVRPQHPPLWHSGALALLYRSPGACDTQRQPGVTPG